MTSITLRVTGAKARAAVRGPLTSGMVGIPVTIEYDDAWQGLTKNLVCRCSKWGPEKGDTRTILNIGETATVAHEVMKPNTTLYLGIEGYNADGTLVIPTTWAKCGSIRYGANAGADPSAIPKLAIWNQLQAEIKQIEKNTVTQEQFTQIQVCTQVASQSAASAQASEENARVSADNAANLANGALQAQKAAEAAAERAEEAVKNVEAGSDSNLTGNGLTTAQIEALDGMFKVCAFTKEDVSTEYSAFKTAFGITDSGGEEEPDEPVTPEVTLTGISAAYSGGDVAVGTAVSDLTDIVVTAHYSDGSTETVTDYTLSGEIAEGENTITVSYGGMTATFAVTGIAESGSENNGWTEDEAYAIEWTEGYGIDHTAANETFGEAVENSARSVSNYLPCLGASAVMIGTGIYKNYGVYFYDGEKKLLQRVNAAYEYPVPVPLNAHYVRVQCITPAGENSTVTPITYPEHSETTVWTAGEYFSAPHNEVGNLDTNTGVVNTTNTGWLTTGFVFCFGAVTLKMNAFTNQYRSQVCYYDADKNVISGSTYTGNTWTIPENAKYFRHSTLNGDQYNNGQGHTNPWFTLE